MGLKGERGLNLESNGETVNNNMNLLQSSTCVAGFALFGGVGTRR